MYQTQPEEYLRQQSPSPSSLQSLEGHHDSVSRLQLPFKCPSANTYYRMWRNRMVISQEGRQFKTAVHQQCAAQSVPQIRGNVRLTISLMFHDRRRRDIDNSLKPLLDALKHLMFEDDDHVMEMYVTKMIGQPADRVDVTVTRL